MANQANRSKFRLAVPLLLVLLATLVTGGIARAGLPASAPAGVSTTEIAGHPARGERHSHTDAHAHAVRPTHTRHLGLDCPAEHGAVWHGRCLLPANRQVLRDGRRRRRRSRHSY